jgi:hypothetical protein
LINVTPYPPYTSARSLIEDRYKTPQFPKASEWFLEHPEHIGELVLLCASDEKHPLPSCASWLLLHIARKNSDLLLPFYEALVDTVLATRNESVLRNLLGALLPLPIVAYKEGELLDTLLGIVNDPNSKPGPLCYTVRKLADFTKIYPELTHEIKLSLSFRAEMVVDKGSTRRALRQFE